MHKLALRLKLTIVIFLPIYFVSLPLISWYMAQGGGDLFMLTTILISVITFFSILVFVDKVIASNRAAHAPAGNHGWLASSYPFVLGLTFLYGATVIAMSIASVRTDNVLIKNLVQQFVYYATALSHPEDLFTILTTIESGIIVLATIGLIAVYACFPHRIAPAPAPVPRTVPLSPTFVSVPSFQPSSAVELTPTPNANNNLPAQPNQRPIHGLHNGFFRPEHKYLTPPTAATSSIAVSTPAVSLPNATTPEVGPIDST